MGARRDNPGDALLDLCVTLDPADIPAARRAAFAVTRACAERHGWPLAFQRLRRIADESLRLYLNPVCGCCKGRGLAGLDRDKPEQGERVRPCTACGGSGREPVPIKHGREIREVLYKMESARREAGARVRKALGLRDVDVE